MKQYHNSMASEFTGSFDIPDHRLERIAGMMIAKYGINALNKAVRAAKFYANENDIEQMRLWVSVSDRIKAREPHEDKITETVQ